MLKIIKKNNLFTILLIFLILNILILLFIDGPFWGILCFPLSFIIISTIYLFLKINKKSKKYNSRFFKIATSSFIILLLLLITYIIYPFFMIGFTHIKSETNESQLKEIISEIIIGKTYDEEKVLTILEWFDESQGNIYNQYHLWTKGIKGLSLYPGSTQLKIFRQEPFVGIRNFLDSDSLWILTSKYGHCGEFALLFRDMCNEAGLEVSLVNCKGENHAWNEVKINGSWIIIDATKHHPHLNGYNLSWDFMEKKVAGDLEGTSFGNVSYVQAKFLNGTIIDVSKTYTNITSITIEVVDENGLAVTGLNVNLFSHNRGGTRNTEYSKNIDNNGECTFDIGGGEYTFIVDTWIPPLYGEIYGNFNETTKSHNVELVTGFDWFKIAIFCLLSFIIIFYSILLIYNYRKKVKSKMVWIKDIKDLCKSKKLDDPSIYTEALYWKSLRAFYHSEKSNELLKSLFDSKDIIKIFGEKWSKLQLGIVTETESCAHNINSMVDVMGQIINLTLFKKFIKEEFLPEGKVTIFNIKDKINKLPNDYKKIEKEILSLINSDEFIYIRDFVNTIKHRNLVMDDWFIYADTKSLKKGIKFLAFKYDKRTHCEKDTSYITDLCRNKIVNHINKIGLEINNYLKKIK
jgi:hypothetical protein